MESGVHGPAGLHVVKHVVMVSGREKRFCDNPKTRQTMADPVSGVGYKKKEMQSFLRLLKYVD